MSILYTTDDTFDVDTSGVLPTLVVFTATWCGPCKILSPILDEVEKKYAGMLNVVKVDIDKCPNTPARFTVRGVPTCMLLSNGKEVGRVLGSTRKTLLDFLDDNI